MRSLLYVLVFLCCIPLSAQQLKSFAYHRETAPDWAKAMYGDHPNFYEVVDAYHDYYASHLWEKNVHTQYFRHWVSEVRAYVQPNGEVRFPEASQLQQTITADNRDDIWSFEGPMHHVDADGSMTPGFRHANVYTIDRSAQNPSVLYCGTESGGAYKSMDAGQHWEYITKGEIIGAVTAIRIHPLNDNLVMMSANNELWRTLDGGVSWQIMGQDSLQNLNISAWEFLFHPADSSVVFAATNHGLFRSADLGDTWIEILPDNCETIVFKPDEWNTFYTIHQDDVGFARFYKSTDNGMNFSLSVNGWFDTSLGDIEITGGRLATTAADPNRIYALLVGYQNPGSSVITNGWVGTWVSTDAGATWSLPHGVIGAPYTADHPNLMNFSGDDGDYTQIHYNTTMVASQLDPNKILIGGLNLWASYDGAATYEPLGGYLGDMQYFHVDQQEYRIFQTGPDSEEIWFGNDGGIGYSTDFMTTHDNLNRGLFAVNLWGYDQGWNEDVMVGGRYHNGNMAYLQNYPEGEFLALGGGEAATGYVQYSDDNRTLFSDIGGRILPENLNETPTYFGVGQTPNENYWNNASSRIMFDHAYFDVAWLGRDHKLYRSENGGGSFSEFYAFGTSDANDLFWMEQSYADHDVMYVQQAMGNNTSKLWRTGDHGNSWEEVPLPSNMRYISFTTSSSNADELWISYYDAGNNNKVYHTVNAGTDWDNLTTPTLSGQSAWAIAHAFGTDGGVYLATLHGNVYYRNNTMNDWAEYSAGLPAGTEPLRLVPFHRDQKLRLACWNLGVWEAPFYEPSALIADFAAESATYFCPGDEVHFVNHSVCGADATLQWFFPGATPSSSNEPYPTVVYNNPGAADVTLIVTENGVSDTITKVAYISDYDNVATLIEEDFESGAIPSTWIAEGNGAWSIAADVSGFGVGAYSMRFDNYYYDAQGARDRIWTGKLNNPGMNLSFDVAYAPYGGIYSDTLAVMYSTDCGNTWTEWWMRGGADLATAPDNANYYVPAASEWMTYELHLDAPLQSDEIIIAFENRGRYGNVIYVDNILVGTDVSVAAQHLSPPVSRIFPNPANDSFTFESQGLKSGEYLLEVFDHAGKMVISKTVFAYNDMMRAYINTTHLSDGNYKVVLQNDVQSSEQGLMIRRR